MTVRGEIREDQIRYPSQEKQKRLQFRKNLSLWAHVRKVYDEGNLLDEEYDDWKIAWPDFIDQDQLYGYTEDPEIAEQLQKQFSENKTTAKTESEGRAKRKRKLFNIVIVLSLNRKRGCKPAKYKCLQPLTYHSISILHK